MKKVITKIITLWMVLIMCIGLFGCTNDYVYNKEDFRLTIEVDKIEVKVGDTLTVTAKFENLSGRNIHIQMSHTRYQKLEDMLLIGLFEEDSEHRFNITSEAGPRKKSTIKKNAVITRTVELPIEELLNHEAAAQVTFYIGKGYSEIVAICSELIKIHISE